MRASHLVLSMLGAGAVGCGSSTPAPDAAPDNPGGTACAQRGTLNATMALDFSQGQAQGAVPTSGKQQLTVTAIITSSTTPDRGFYMIQINNGGLYSAAAGKAGRFETPPAPGSYPIDADADLGFGIDFVNGVTHNGNTASANPTQIALLDPTAGGTVRIDSFTPAAVPGGTSTIGATITNAKFKGFNVSSTGGVDPAGNGCDITIQNLQFTGMSVQWQAAAFPAIVAPAPRAAPDVMARTRDVSAAISADFQIE